jgi:hypothetical protein
VKTIRIDVHYHLLTQKYLEELAQVGVVGSGGVPFPQWIPEDSASLFGSRGDSDGTALALHAWAVFWQ